MGRSLRRGLRVAVLGLALLAVGGCGDGPDADGVRLNIGMLDNFFARDVNRVPVGQEIRFSNAGQVDHNAFAVDGTWQTDELIPPGSSDTITIDEEGVYRFICTLHADPEGLGGMSAWMVVGDVDFDIAEAEAELHGLDPDVDVSAVATWTGETRAVPDEFATIQSAVDAAEPGDLVLIDPGVYPEQVNVTTPSITIRGRDRNEVVIDGEFLRPNGINVLADGVAVENLTIRNATQNGLFFTGLTGYRASYVTAHNNGVYGIYSFDADDGLFEHSYASGSPDAGFYVGQCDPCRMVITDVIAEWNALGYSGTNAGGELYIVSSTWRDNISGIVPNTLDSELLPPFEDVVIAKNLIHDNGNSEAPTLSLEWPTWGSGVILAGGNDAQVHDNVILDNRRHGVMVTPNLDVNFWFSSRNRVHDNIIRGSGMGDLALSGPAGEGNCFARNDHRTSRPIGLERGQSCDGVRLPLRWDISTTLHSLGFVAEAQRRTFPDNPYAEAPVPGPQPQMPGGADAEVRPAVDVFDSVGIDVATAELPPDAHGMTAARSQELMVFGIPMFAAGGWSIFFGLYAGLLPFVLYAAWTALALWDLARREDMGRGGVLGWIAVILLVPFLGVIAYHAFGRSLIPGWLRGAIIGGGLAAYLVILGVGAAIGGIV